MILVTGATGILGSHILYGLASEGKPVRALYRDKRATEKTRKIFNFYVGEDDSFFSRIEWVQADINDFYSLGNALDGVSHVYHAAGMVSFNDRDKKKLKRVNTDGTANMVNACLEAGNVSLCHVSSIATLGEPEDEKTISEDIIWNRGHAASAYAISKHRGEMEVWRGINEGLNAVIVNPSVIIGPGMWTGPGKELFNTIQKGLKFYPRGSSGYVDVRDVARIMITLSENGIYGERFILNAGNMSNKDFINLLAENLGKKGPQIEISDFMARTAVIAEYIRAFITAGKPRITLLTLTIAAEELYYSNKKISEKLHIDFIPIEQSLQEAANLYFKYS
jgi:nucleoside-diphosphate-sugar epimerase